MGVITPFMGGDAEVRTFLQHVRVGDLKVLETKDSGTYRKLRAELYA